MRRNDNNRNSSKKSFDKKKKVFKSDDRKKTFRDDDKKPYGEKRKFAKDKKDFIKDSSDLREDKYSKKKPYGAKKTAYGNNEDKRSYKGKRDDKKPFEAKKKPSSAAKRSVDGKIRLNRFLSQAGICSRREADTLITSGIVQINDKVVEELGTKVDPLNDVVKYDGKTVKLEGLRYVLLNKPKDFITTSKDPQNRKTVMHLVENACIERIYPVGRLDRQTLGVLLFTNDGDLAEKLTHPRNNINKTYLVETNKKIDFKHIKEFESGIELEDGTIKVDEIRYIDPTDKRTVSVTIHSGKNRIVRRMFEHFDYDIKKLDRVDFAGLNKKGLRRGEWRVLEPKEVGFLKLM